MRARLLPVSMAALVALMSLQLTAPPAEARPPDERPSLSGPDQTAPDALFAVTLRLPASVAAIDGRMGYAANQAELIGVAPAGGGTAFRPVGAAGGAAFGAFGLKGANGLTALDLVVDPQREGRLQISVVIDTATDANGAPLVLEQTEFTTTITIGDGGALLKAPKFKDRQKADRKPGKTRELQADGRFDKVDLDAARQAWDATRSVAPASGDVCGADATLDPNRDGCADIADVAGDARCPGRVDGSCRGRGCLRLHGDQHRGHARREPRQRGVRRFGRTLHPSSGDHRDQLARGG